MSAGCPGSVIVGEHMGATRKVVSRRQDKIHLSVSEWEPDLPALSEFKSKTS